MFLQRVVCFDTPLVRGNGGIVGLAIAILRRSAWASRAAAARHHFQTLDFLAHGFVEDGVGQEDQPVRAGVGVVLTSFPWTEYARLFGVHSSVPTFLWAGLRGGATPAGPFIYPTLISYLFSFLSSTCFVALLSLFSVE
jgi:hypothetical protein